MLGCGNLPLVEAVGLAIILWFRQNAFWRSRSFPYHISSVTAALRPKNTPPECFCSATRWAGLSIPFLFRLQKQKRAFRLFFFFGGGGGNRTHVRKPLNATFSGCRVPTVFSGEDADTRASSRGSLLMHDRYKSELSVHVRCSFDARRYAAALITRTSGL